MNIKLDARKRLQYIEYLLFWLGKANLGDVMKTFHISRAQASIDFSSYKCIANNNIRYDTRLKTYVASREFTPAISQPDPHEFLRSLIASSDQVLSGWTPSIAITTQIKRFIDKDILRHVVIAMRDKLDLYCFYISMSNPEPYSRWITPHAIAHNGDRWHIRAYCHKDGRFKDFLFSRIIRIDNERSSSIDPATDFAWNKFQDVIIIPHPGLSEAQKQNIILDYGMKDNEITIKVRLSLLFYFLKHYGLEYKKDSNPPKEYPLILKNIEEIREILRKS